eukprot:TRINITY_DN13949_c0_g1_i2.p1 TRINITY_DN13949_c0_g1~~TRINITY_DN13949_c0_g1_i2.p1  ORF type:complete len:618 (-),score=71.63 TRINITY_DN13949_c0_g1_i2:503-2356(-)
MNQQSYRQQHFHKQQQSQQQQQPRHQQDYHQQHHGQQEPHQQHHYENKQHQRYYHQQHDQRHDQQHDQQHQSQHRNQTWRHQDWSSRCKMTLSKDGQRYILDVQMSDSDLGDAEMAEWCSWMGGKLQPWLPTLKQSLRLDPYINAPKMDFSKNRLGADGVRSLCDFMQRYCIVCEVFQLHKNRLDDDALKDLCKYLTCFNRASVRELHLSHNQLSITGVQWLLAAISLHPGYPAYCEKYQQFVPLWLRVEWNTITPSDAPALLKFCAEMGSTVCCGQTGCRARFCGDPGVAAGQKHNCVAHLCYVFNTQGETSVCDLAPHGQQIYARPSIQLNPTFKGARRQEPIVIYEDDELACIFKPASWICSNAPAEVDPNWWQLTKAQASYKLREWMMRPGAVPIHAWIVVNFGWNSLTCRNPSKDYGLAHRLDKDTSGPMLVGKTDRGYEHFQTQLRTRDTLKDYICLVHGRLQPERGELNKAIDITRYQETRRVRVCPDGEYGDGKEAITIYEVLARYKCEETGSSFSLVHVRLVTGRTHQIRAHFSDLGHPLVGEETYATPSRWAREASPRIFLHKYRVGFLDMNSQVVVKSCPLQMVDDLWQTLGYLTCTERLGQSWQW